MHDNDGLKYLIFWNGGSTFLPNYGVVYMD
jgi:hypothetical protein